jgi:NodT family efflux transporter outer membrane factor (OMF) lipoprotein
MKKLLPWAAPLLLLTACNFAPKYSRPAVAGPDAFKEGAGAAPAAVRWEPAQPRDAAARAKWWERYDDPILDDLEEQVAVSNQTLKGDEAAYRQARALTVEARSALFPTVSTSPSYTAFRSSQTLGNSAGAAGGTAAGGGTVISSGGGRGQTYSLPVEASYEPDLWGQIRNNVAVNADNAQASAGNLAAARLSIQAQLAQDYFQVRALDEERRILDATAAAYRDNLNLTRELFRDGIDSSVDVAQAQAQLDTEIAQATDLENPRAQSEHAIAVLIGKAPADFSLAVAKFSAVPPPVPVALPSELLERRPDIAAAERLVAAANAEIGVTRAAYFPALTLSATAGFESSHFSQWLTWPSRFWSLGPELSETLLDFGNRRGQNEHSRAAYDQAVANYRQTVLNAFEAVEDNLAALRVLTTEAEQRRTAVDSARAYVDLAKTRFQAGIDSYLNVSAAETANLTNEEAAVQTQLQLMQASVALVTAMGGGWEASDLPR